MTAKDYSLYSFNDKYIAEDCAFNRRYSNLNLNQNNERTFVNNFSNSKHVKFDKIKEVQDYGKKNAAVFNDKITIKNLLFKVKTIFFDFLSKKAFLTIVLKNTFERTAEVIKMLDIIDKSKARKNSILWNKSNKSFDTLNIIHHDSDKEFKEKNVKSTSNSTLSFHISAFETSIKASASDLFDENENLTSKKKSLIKSIFPDSIQNLFEFPRQQGNDKNREPEIAQFKASQKFVNHSGLNAARKKCQTMAAQDVSAHQLASVDMINATSKLQLEAADVRNNTATKPNWTSYLRSQLIPQDEYNFISAYEAAKNKQERDEVLNRDPNSAARAMISLVTDVAKDQIIRYILTLFDDMLQEDKSRVDIFHAYARKQKRTIWSWFQGTLARQDAFIVNQMSSIFAKLACFGTTLMEEKELSHYFGFLLDQLKAPNNEYINTTARCLQMMLRVDEYRVQFCKGDGITSLLSALNGKANFQLQYQLIFCLWSLSFNPEIASKIQQTGAIQVLGDILSECSKEKVIRIIFATFRNILEKIDDRDIQRLSALQMVQCKTTKTLELMDAKKFDDTDLQEDIEFLSEKLHASVQDLSSFDEYCTEVRSGRLQWSPVHKSDKFWRENAQRLNEKNFELLKILIKLLETSQDILVLCVAAHDIGEYVRHYPRGKNIIEQFQGKQAVMRLLSAEDPNVRYHALLAVQKLMVHNWEYLGKQLESEKAGDAVPAN